MNPDHLDDDAHNFTLRQSFEVARIVEMLLDTDETIRIKVAAMFAVVLADNQGIFRTQRRLNHFQDTSEIIRDRVKAVYKAEREASCNT